MGQGMLEWMESPSCPSIILIGGLEQSCSNQFTWLLLPTEWVSGQDPMQSVAFFQGICSLFSISPKHYWLFLSLWCLSPSELSSEMNIPNATMGDRLEDLGRQQWRVIRMRALHLDLEDAFWFGLGSKRPSVQLSIVLKTCFFGI